MNEETLDLKIQEATRKFDELVPEKNRIDDEMAKLQGEFRVLTELKKEHFQPLSEDPNTVIAEEVSDAE